MLARYVLWPYVCLSVCPSICLSQAGVRLNAGKSKQRSVIALHGFQLSGAKLFGEIPMGLPPMGAPNARGVE